MNRDETPIKWMRKENRKYYDILENGNDVIMHRDAPQEVIDSYKLWRKINGLGEYNVKFKD